MTYRTYLQAHPDPVRAVVSWQSNNTDTILATASKDQTLKCWSIKQGQGQQKGENGASKGKTADVAQIATLKGHINSVESVDYWASKNILLSGDWAGNLVGWNVETLQDDAAADEEDSNSSRRKKMKVSE